MKESIIIVLCIVAICSTFITYDITKRIRAIEQVNKEQAEQLWQLNNKVEQRLNTELIMFKYEYEAEVKRIMKEKKNNRERY